MISWEYVAGFFDGEGTVRVPCTSKSITATFTLVQSGDEGKAVLSDIQAFLKGQGIQSVLMWRSRRTTEAAINSKRPMWTLGVYRRAGVERILRELLPFVHVKKVAVQDILRFLKLNPPIGAGTKEFRLLSSEAAQKRCLPIEVIKARRKIWQDAYFQKNKERIRAYRAKWNRERRMRERLARMRPTLFD